MDSKKRCSFPYIREGKPIICQYPQKEGELHCGKHIQACARNPCILHRGKAPTTNKGVSVLFLVPGAAPERLSIQEGKVYSHSYMFKNVKHHVHIEIETSVPSSSSSSSSASSSPSSSSNYSPIATQPNKRRRADDAGAHTIPLYTGPLPHDNDAKHPTSVIVRYVQPHREEARGVQEYHRRTIKQIETALKNAEKARRALELDESSNMDDVVAVALEVKTLTLELNKRRAVEQLQYERHTTTLSCVVVAGRPHRLEGVPGEPEVWVYSGAVQVGMVKTVLSESVLTPVPEDYKIEGKYKAEIKVQFHPMCVACHEGLVYVTHYGSSTVSVCDVVDEKVVRSWPLHGGGQGYGVVVHEQSVYIVNDRLRCIQVYGLDGTFQRQFGSKGTGPGEFNAPCGLVIGGDDQLYVCDCHNHRVQVFGLDGSHVRSWGSKGTGPGEFHCPTGMAVDEECVYVCDSNNHRVQVFGLDGTFQHMLGSYGTGEGKFKYPLGAIVQGELLYVSDEFNHRVQVFEKETGTFVRSWGSRGEGPGQFVRPYGMALDEEGKLCVCDLNNHRVQVFE